MNTISFSRLSAKQGEEQKLKTFFNRLTELFTFKKSQMDLFGNTPMQEKSKIKGVGFAKMNPKSQPHVGDTKMEGGRKLVFLETTMGKPRWHTPEEVEKLKNGFDESLVRVLKEKAKGMTELNEFTKFYVDLISKPGNRETAKELPSLLGLKPNADLGQIFTKLKDGKESSTQKQPWEMTKKEYANSGSELSEVYHRNAVISAFGEGKPVPENVLAEYPELKKNDDKKAEAKKAIGSRGKAEQSDLREELNTLKNYPFKNREKIKAIENKLKSQSAKEEKEDDLSGKINDKVIEHQEELNLKLVKDEFKGDFAKMTPKQYQEAVVKLSQLSMPELRKQQAIVSQQQNAAYERYEKDKSQKNTQSLFKLKVMKQMRIDAIDRKNFNPKGNYGDTITDLKKEYEVTDSEDSKQIKVGDFVKIKSKEEREAGIAGKSTIMGEVKSVKKEKIEIETFSNGFAGRMPISHISKFNIEDVEKTDNPQFDLPETFEPNPIDTESKEGDIKTIAGVSYQLKKGESGELRWHRMDSDKKTIDPDLQPLAEEAKKYSTAEEFDSALKEAVKGRFDKNGNLIDGIKFGYAEYSYEIANKLSDKYKNLKEFYNDAKKQGEQYPPEPTEDEEAVESFMEEHAGIETKGNYIINYKGKTYDRIEPMTDDDGEKLFLNGSKGNAYVTPADFDKLTIETASDFHARTEKLPEEITEENEQELIPQKASSKESKRQYVDVGEKIGGARKDVWSEKLARGEVLVAGDVDLDELEKDPSRAYRTVTKENYIQKVKEHIELFQTQGYESGAIFLMMKLNDFIAPKPEDNPTARKNFVSATELLQKTVYQARTAKDLIDSIKELSQMKRGFYVPEDDKQKIAVLRAKYQEGRKELQVLQQELNKYYARQQELSHAKWKFEHRKKEVPKEVLSELEDQNQKWSNLLKEIKPIEEANDKIFKEYYAIEKKWDTAADEDPYSTRNIIKSLGEKFETAIDRRSQAFVDAMNKGLNIPADNWDWIPQGVKRRDPKKSIDILKAKQWRRETPETLERVGEESKLPETFKPEDLLKTFGIRGVEYGNWMDEESSKHHTHLAGMALFDLANILDIPIEKISYNGRLAIAFGARGLGAIQHGAVAHYESTKEVINMTKFSGGGSLAHEWGHFMDNILSKISFEEKTGKRTYLSEGGIGDVIAPEVKTTIQGVMDAMKEGEYQRFETIAPNEKWKSYTWRVVDGFIKDGFTAQQIFDTVYPTFQSDYERIKKYYGNSEYDKKHLEKAKKKHEKKVTELAQYLASKMDQNVNIPDKKYPKTSKFYATSLNQGGYYSSPVEMFARCFESYISDKLDERKLKNTYLVSGVSEKNVQNYLWYKKTGGAYDFTDRTDPQALPLMPYPEGEERKRIMSAMDKFIESIKQNEMFEKAILIMETL